MCYAAGDLAVFALCRTVLGHRVPKKLQTVELPRRPAPVLRTYQCDSYRLPDAIRKRRHWSGVALHLGRSTGRIATLDR